MLEIVTSTCNLFSKQSKQNLGEGNNKIITKKLKTQLFELRKLKHTKEYVYTQKCPGLINLFV